MPRPTIDRNSAHLYPRERAVSLDWIDGKNVRLLRVANHRESFRVSPSMSALIMYMYKSQAVYSENGKERLARKGNKMSFHQNI